ncbi:323_t:CDS:2 [Entrophospora sp. SA101]|nr:323_t:CDS:2 [Entrophospora sp. SA101]
MSGAGTIDIAFSDTPFAKRPVFPVQNARRDIILLAKKGDEYVRIVGSKIADWSASEAGASWEGEHDTKIMKESGLTLPKTLKDITLNYAKREF